MLSPKVGAGPIHEHKTALKCWPAHQEIVQNYKEAQEKTCFLSTPDEQKIFGLEVTGILEPQALRRDLLIGVLESQEALLVHSNQYVLGLKKSHTGTDNVRYLPPLALLLLLATTTPAPLPFIS